MEKMGRGHKSSKGIARLSRSRSRSKDNNNKNEFGNHAHARNRKESDDLELMALEELDSSAFIIDEEEREKRVLQALEEKRRRREEFLQKIGASQQEVKSEVSPLREKPLIFEPQLEQTQIKLQEVDTKKYDMFTGSSESSDDEQNEKQILTSEAKIDPQVNRETVDDELYYKPVIGEVLNKRFKVIEEMGRGVYGSVLKAEEIITGRFVAIKILRNVEIITRAGEREWTVVNKLNKSDYFDKMHILRFLDFFSHKQHLCIVAELLDLNLRDTITIYGQRVGLGLDSVKSYAYQLFLALYHLKKNGIVHADIKPDNLMVSADLKKCKLIDFGNAMYIEDLPRTGELVARYYRAPEIILGLPLGYPIDIWSAAVSIFEIYTGKLLFDGYSDNAMLKQMMELQGQISTKILRKGLQITSHFDLSTNLFLSREVDRVTLTESVKAINMGAIKRVPLKERLGIPDDSTDKNMHRFKDLLEKCLHLDPEKRISIEDAVRHRFFEGTRARKTIRKPKTK